VKADTLGSLEAIAAELGNREIPVKMAQVGDVARRDVTDATTLKDPLHRVILAFNVKVSPDAREALLAPEAAHLIEDKIIYSLLDRYQEWVAETKRKLETDLRGEITFPGKVKVLEDKVFRVNNPAIFGVRVLVGRLRVGQRFLRTDGRVVGRVKSIRRGEESVKEALQGEEVPISVEDVQVGRQISAGDEVFVEIPESHARELRRSVMTTGGLTMEETEVFERVTEIKRREAPFWSM
ncbi:MAG: translation initiation factor IF-2, partial [Methanobacteriota archaeon]